MLIEKKGLTKLSKAFSKTFPRTTVKQSVTEHVENSNQNKTIEGGKIHLSLFQVN